MGDIVSIKYATEEANDALLSPVRIRDKISCMDAQTRDGPCQKSQAFQLRRVWLLVQTPFTTELSQTDPRSTFVGL